MSATSMNAQVAAAVQNARPKVPSATPSEHFLPDRPSLCRPADLSVACQHRRGRLDFPANLGWQPKRRAHPRVGGTRAGRDHHQFAGRAGLALARQDRDAPCHRRRSDAHGGTADSPDRRTHRDPFPRVRLAGVPGFLPRLARADLGKHRGLPAIIGCAACFGRNRFSDRRRPPAGSGWSTRAGSFSRMCFSSIPAFRESRKRK